MKAVELARLAIIALMGQNSGTSSVAQSETTVQKLQYNQQNAQWVGKAFALLNPLWANCEDVPHRIFLPAPHGVMEIVVNSILRRRKLQIERQRDSTIELQLVPHWNLLPE